MARSSQISGQKHFCKSSLQLRNPMLVRFFVPPSALSRRRRLRNSASACSICYKSLQKPKIFRSTITKRRHEQIKLGQLLKKTEISNFAEAWAPDESDRRPEVESWQVRPQALLRHGRYQCVRKGMNWGTRVMVCRKRVTMAVVNAPERVWMEVHA